MDTFLLLLIITASGVCAASSQVPRRYFFYYELKTMPEALEYCREKHKDLVSIHSEEELNTLWSMVDQSQIAAAGHGAWIGLYDDVDSWRWSLSDPSFYGPGEAEFRTWLPTEPNNVNGIEHCTAMTDQGNWNDFSCTNTLQGVCSDVSGTTVTFVLTPTTMTWTQAQSYCREHHTDLASVRNPDENQRVKDTVPSGGGVWIGLYRKPWKWTDGSDDSFLKWRADEPNNFFGQEMCVAEDFGSAGGWRDWRCDQKKAFICYQEAGGQKQVIKLSVQTKNPSLNLNDPAVLEEILEQLKQNLKDEGLDENVRLSWRKKPSGIVFQKVENEKEREARELSCPI